MLKQKRAVYKTTNRSIKKNEKWQYNSQKKKAKTVINIFCKTYNTNIKFIHRYYQEKTIFPTFFIRKQKEQKKQFFYKEVERLEKIVFFISLVQKYKNPHRLDFCTKIEQFLLLLPLLQLDQQILYTDNCFKGDSKYYETRRHFYDYSYLPKSVYSFVRCLRPCCVQNLSIPQKHCYNHKAVLQEQPPLRKILWLELNEKETFHKNPFPRKALLCV